MGICGKNIGIRYISVSAVVIVVLIGILSNALSAVTRPKDNTPKKELQIGNFLNDNAYWTTHVLMSPHISDTDRTSIIKRAKKPGYNRIHIYGTNDDNYSERRGGNWWAGINNIALFYNADQDFNHWFHWFVQCRKNGLKITLWLWPNDAQKTYNNESVWDDDRVVKQMKALIDFGSTRWNKTYLVDEFVLKLEADDEWSIDRINRISARVKPLLKPGQTLWYHNQTTDLQILKSIAWKYFDGIRYQFSERSSREAVQTQAISVINALPKHLKFYGSEYAVWGDRDKHIGDWILELVKDYPQIVGVDNGATVSKSGNLK